MNRIESAVTACVSGVTPLEFDSAAVPVATPYAIAGLALGAAALGYQVGYHDGSPFRDDLSTASPTPGRLQAEVSSDDLLAARSAIVAT